MASSNLLPFADVQENSSMAVELVEVGCSGKMMRGCYLSVSAGDSEWNGSRSEPRGMRCFDRWNGGSDCCARIATNKERG